MTWVGCVRCGTHHAVPFWSRGGDDTTVQTSCYDKALHGHCTVVVVSTFISVLEIGRPLIWVEEKVKVVLPFWRMFYYNISGKIERYSRDYCQNFH